MSKEKLINKSIRVETKFDKIRKNLWKLFYDKEQYAIKKRLDMLIVHKRPEIGKIIIPKEIGKKGF